MKSSQWWLLLPFAFSATFASLHAGPVEEITSYSSFKQIDINALSSGTILTQRGSFAGFSRGLALQSCYIVNKPMAATADFLVWWDPTPHSELDVYVSTNFRRGEDPKFDQLKIDGKQKAVQLLLDDVAKAKGTKSDLQLSQAELADLRQRLSTAPNANTDSPEFRKLTADFFTNLLKQRFAAFQNGGVGALPEYEYDGGKLSVKGEINSLVKGDVRVAAHFKDLLNDILNDEPKTPPATAGTYYWQLFKADTEAALAQDDGYLPAPWQRLVTSVALA